MKSHLPDAHLSVQQEVLSRWGCVCGDNDQLDPSMAGGFGQVCGTGGQGTRELRVLAREWLPRRGWGSGWEGKRVQTGGVGLLGGDVGEWAQWWRVTRRRGVVRRENQSEPSWESWGQGVAMGGGHWAPVQKLN